MVRGICFDLFNTLVNVADVPAEHGRFTADILGVSREDWNQACFGDQHEICRPVGHFASLRTITNCIDPTIPDAVILAATRERQQRFNHALRTINHDALAVLSQLRQQGYRLGLISNASSAEIQAWHDSPLADQFDSVVFSCDCGARKPHPTIYQQALERLELAAAECLFIGDGGSREHHGAVKVGMRSVLLTQHLLPSEVATVLTTQGDVLYSQISQLSGVFEILEGERDKLQGQ